MRGTRPAPTPGRQGTDEKFWWSLPTLGVVKAYDMIVGMQIVQMWISAPVGSVALSLLDPSSSRTLSYTLFGAKRLKASRC